MSYRLLACVILALFPLTMPADGCAFKVDRDWPRISEEAQCALLHWRNGRQAMPLGVHLTLAGGDSGVWLVPVRGRPDEIRVELIEDLPWMRRGIVDPQGQARRRFHSTCATIGGLLGPGAPISYLVATMLLVPNLLESRVSAMGSVEGRVIVRDGLVVTLLPALASSSLSEALAAVGRPVPADKLRHLDAYADGAHSILAVRIDPTSAGPVDGSRWQGRMPAVLLDFPSPEPWFPMRGSAGGGSTQVHLQLAGWWQTTAPVRQTPVLDAQWGAVQPVPALCTWMGLSQVLPPERTTRVDVSATTPSSFAQDLVFASIDHRQIEAAAWIMRIPSYLWLLAGWLLLVICGMVGGLVAGRLLLRRPWWGARFAALGSVGGALTLWLALHVWVTRHLRLTYQERRSADAVPLQPGFWFAAGIGTLPAMLAILMVFSFARIEWAMTGGALAIGLLYAMGWVIWGLHGGVHGRRKALRRRGAWLHATLGLAVALMVVLVWPLAVLLR
jgi:hypothetical protein